MSRESCEVQTAVLETTWGRVIVQVSPTGVVACELPVLAGPPANPLRITRVQLPKKSTALARRALRAAQGMLAETGRRYAAVDRWYLSGHRRFGARLANGGHSTGANPDVASWRRPGIRRGARGGALQG